MEFSLDRFYRLNRRVIIWVVLFALIYFLRDFFTLIFLTFITGFFSFPAIRFLMDRFHINRVAAVSLVHVGILLGFIGIVWTISPNLVGELATFQQNLDGYEQAIKDLRTPYEERYPNLVRLFESYVPNVDESITQQRVRVEAFLPPVAGQLFTLGWTSLLAILFSFMITYDYVRLSRQVQSLRSSKLRDFYEEAGQPVVKFATSIGRGFQALVTIAFITTGMITVVMALFGLPSLALLALIVFLSSLIPVVGVIFELAAVGLVTLNQFGPDRTLWVLGTLLSIHVLV
ncbi:AI-2E family transporter, partial [Candidatus Sumerlaeota bacterium]|nr:AI-2E family transporter [Candidatus Sumerlaeota bacterium]